MKIEWPDLGVKVMSIYVHKLFGESIVCDIVLGERTVAVQALLPNKLVFSAMKTFQIDEKLDIPSGIKICEEAIKTQVTVCLKKHTFKNGFKPDLIDDTADPMIDQMHSLRTNIRAAELELRKRMNDPFFLESETIRGQHAEVKANLMLAIRHLEDARMRCGKVLQYMDNGESIYGD